MDNQNIDPTEYREPMKADASRPPRGKLKIFFGYAAGVGKTYAMLEGAHAQKVQGVDVVIGYVETHGCIETELLLNGLQVLPWRVVNGNQALHTEFDLDAALARRPALILIDELAHTNAAGARHTNRWQDVQELLESGFNVYASLNVQHLESLNDVVTRVTGITVRDTIPDTLVDQADELELIDLAPDDLIQRFEDGKVCLPEDIAQTVPHFFPKGNLIVLRELALRCVADRVDAQMQDYRRDQSVARAWPVRERILVGVDTGSSSTRLFRAAQRMATALHAEWLAVHIETPDYILRDPAGRDRIVQILHIAEKLGAETTTLTGHSVSEELLAFAHSRNITKIIVGKASSPRWRQVLFGSVSEELVRKSGDIDVYVVTGERDEPQPRRVVQTLRSINWPGYLWAVFAVMLCTAISEIIFPYFSLTDLVMIYLTGIVLVAAFHNLGPSILASILSVLAFDFFFVPPTLSFAFNQQHFFITYIVFLLLGIVISVLTSQIRHQGEAARQRERYTATLYALSRDLARTWGKNNLIETATRHIGQVLDCQVAILLPDPPERFSSKDQNFPLDLNERGLVEWVYAHGQPAGLGTETLRDSKALYLPLMASRRTVGVLGAQLPHSTISPEQFHLLELLASQTALAIERTQLVEESQKAIVQIETERMRNALLSSISHDLKTPLAGIMGAAGDLLEGEVGTRRELVQTISEEADRLNRLIRNLLDMTRLEAGALQVRKEWHLAEEIVGATLARLDTRLHDHPVTTHIPDDMPLIPLDGVLIDQVLGNLLENAIKYTPAGSPIDISVEIMQGSVVFQIADCGPGIPIGDEERVFDKFYRARPDGGGVGLGLTICRGIVEAHGGRIWALNRPEGGALFQFTLPLEGRPPEFKPEEMEVSE
jgi:two-component system sensor histidine kinase KdpD